MQLMSNKSKKHTQESHEAVVVSSRLRLARNLVDQPFPSWAKESQRRDILAQCFEALKSLTEFKQAQLLKMDDLNVLERQILVEKHLVSRELSTIVMGSGVCISKDAQCAVMVNEEDHLRVQALSSGFGVSHLFDTLQAIDSGLEKHLDFAFSSKLGYLTACPTNLGTGMRASVMMHLPGLVIGGHMEQVIRAVNHMGIAVRGIFGEGSEASGSMFQISNQQTLGFSEREIIERLESVLRQIIDHEMNARYKLLENKRDKVLDKIGRAYGILCNSYTIATEEAMQWLSLMRLAVDMKVLPQESRGVIDQLMIDIQPAHMQQRIGSGESDTECRDAARARLLREHFLKIASLDFSKLPEVK